MQGMALRRFGGVFGEAPDRGAPRSKPNSRTSIPTGLYFSLYRSSPPLGFPLFRGFGSPLFVKSK